MKGHWRHLTLVWGTLEGFPEVPEGFVKEVICKHRSVSSKKKKNSWNGQELAKRPGVENVFQVEERAGGAMTSRPE